MDMIVIAISLSLIGLALSLVLYPLWQQAHHAAFLEVDPTHQTLEELQTRYQASLAAIKDLMFDHEMGKVSTDDYEALLSRTKIEAAHIRQQIDQLDMAAADAPIVARTTADAPIESSLETEIEEAISQMRRRPPTSQELLAEVEAEIEALKDIGVERLNTPVCSHCGRELRLEDAFCSGCGQAVTPVENCPQCGYAYQPGDAFCARCGAVLKAGVEVPDYEDTRL
jgi:hypothetical protein